MLLGVMVSGAVFGGPIGQLTNAPAPTRSKTPSTTTASPETDVRVYPNPWRVDKDAGVPLTFDHAGSGATIKIYTISARLVRTLSAEEGSAQWDLTNSDGKKVASGYYLYVVTDSTGNKTRGKLAIIR
jgi:flagellar hook assembly protein FlgD